MVRRCLRRFGNRRNERGGALVELAIAIPIFLALIALIFDAGLGFSAARSSSTAARSAARAAALAGDERMADFRALDAVRAQYANSSDEVVQVTVYRSAPGSNGEVPAACTLFGSSVVGLCNVYPGSILESLNPGSFVNDLCAGEPDQAWCPTGRRLNDGDYLGVAVWTKHVKTIGLTDIGSGGDSYDLNDRAVFALYFPPAPVTPPGP